jgi:hypothetical protein
VSGTADESRDEYESRLAPKPDLDMDSTTSPLSLYVCVELSLDATSAVSESQCPDSWIRGGCCCMPMTDRFGVTGERDCGRVTRRIRVTFGAKTGPGYGFNLSLV